MAHTEGPARDLLFGLLALQTGLIDASKLVSAFQAWGRDKGRSLADHLVDQGGLNPADRPLLDGLAAAHLRRHGGDSARSLAALADAPGVAEEVVRAAGPEIESTLGRPPGAVSVSVGEPPSERTSTFIAGRTSMGPNARYRVLRPHAKGGLGAVYVALDGELNREVALKQVLERHADDPDGRARFLLEAEITGNLEHPGIVPVYGLGSDDKGRPYYVMRFIQGDSLKDTIQRFHETVCDPSQRSLELRQLLRRFLDVCNAIEYAHSRGVLHRDIKPANIVLGRHGETLVVDWGLAKVAGRADPTSGEHTLRPLSASGSAETLPGAALGTPSYMSPEQARGATDSLGPRSDVYSLGATLYGLLTGRAPFEGDDIGAILHAVRAGTFLPPRKVAPGVEPALEAICLKAMALDPKDRYDGPRALADDIERWMADEPVTARRDPFGERARRWARRNRAGVTAAVAATLVAVVGLGAIAFVREAANRALRQANAGLAEANEQLRESHRREARANDSLRRLNEDLVASNQRERDRFDLALEAVRTLHGGVTSDVLLRQPELRSIRDRLLDSARAFYGRLQAEAGTANDPRSRAALGRAYHELGELTAQVGDTDSSIEVHRKALIVRRPLAQAAQPGDASRLGLAETLTALTRLYLDKNDQDGFAAAIEEARQVLDSERNQGPVQDTAHRRLLTAAYRELANALESHGRRDTARELHLLALQASQRGEASDIGLRAEAALTWTQLGWLFAKGGDSRAESRRAFETALELRRAIHAARPEDQGTRLSLAGGLVNLAFCLGEEGRLKEALDAYDEALALYEPIARARPDDLGIQADLARAYDYRGHLLMSRADDTLPAALEGHRKALAIRRRVAEAHPTVVAFQLDLARSQDYVASALSRLGKQGEAIVAHREALAAREAIAKAHPNDPEAWKELGWSHHNIGYMHGLNNEPEAAVAAHRRALEVRRELVRRYPGSPEHAYWLIDSLRHIGNQSMRAGHGADATEAFREAMALRERQAPKPQDLYEVACFQAQIAEAAKLPDSGLRPDEEADKALTLLRRAVDAGFRDLKRLRDDYQFGGLRWRPDHALVLLDAAFPSDPF